MNQKGEDKMSELNGIIIGYQETNNRLSGVVADIKHKANQLSSMAESEVLSEKAVEPATQLERLKCELSTMNRYVNELIDIHRHLENTI